MHFLFTAHRFRNLARRRAKPRFALVVPTLAALLAPATASAQDVVGWGYLVFNSAWNREPFAEIAAGGSHTVARRSDGSVVAWGDNSIGQCKVPALPPGLTYVEIAAGL